MQSNDEFVNVLLVGKPETGKSEFLKQYVDSEAKFSERYKQTMLYDFRSKTAKIDKSSVSCIIYDLSGQYWISNTAIPFSNKFNIIVIFVDASVQPNNDEIETQLRKIKDEVQGTTRVIFVMSKSDLLDKPTIERRQDELNRMISDLNTTYHLNINRSIQVISSKDKSGLKELDNELMNEVKMITEQRNMNSKQSSLVNLLPPKKRSFMTRRPIVTALLVGASLGFALTVTGVFAPFGVAITGAIALGAIGLIVFGVAAGLIKYLTRRTAEIPSDVRGQVNFTSNVQHISKSTKPDDLNVSSHAFRLFETYGYRSKSSSHNSAVKNDKGDETSTKRTTSQPQCRKK